MDSVEGISSPKDAEISIFDAEKYFSEECNESKQQREEKPSHDPRLSSSLPSPGGHGRSLSIAGSLRTTPSSASSINSQTSLIVKHGTSKRWFAAKKWFLTRNCCCSNGKSVRVEELISNSDRRGPIVVMDSRKSNTIMHADRDGNDQSQKQKIASEIMSLSRFSILDNVVEIHHVRGLDAPRQQRISATGRPFISGAVGFTFPITDRATVARDDDVGSDASSDLFEIESFSTQPIAGKDSNSETKVIAANGGNRRLSAAGDGCYAESLMEVGLDEGKIMTSDGMRLMTCQPENAAAAATAVKCVAGGPPAISLHVGGRPLPARRGRSQSSPLVVAG